MASVSALAIFTGLCWNSWRKLNLKEYKKIQRQAQWVREQQDQELRATKKVEHSGSLSFHREDEDEQSQE